MSRRSQELREALEDAALVGAKEMKRFLELYGGADAPEVPRDRFKVVLVARDAVKECIDQQSSQNNMVTSLMNAARLVGVAPEQTLEILKTTGILPESATSTPERLKLAK